MVNISSHIFTELYSPRIGMFYNLEKKLSRRQRILERCKSFDGGGGDFFFF